MGSNWWFRFTFVVALLLLAVRTLLPTFGPLLGEQYHKPDYLPAYKKAVEREEPDKKGELGKVIKDKDGKPKIKYRKYEKGKRKGQTVKDENGNPLPFFEKKNGKCQLQYSYEPIYEAEVAYVLDPKTKKPKIDPKTKKPIVKKDKKGNPVPKRDKKGQIVWKKDAKGNLIVRKDAKGNPVIKRDKSGQFIIPKAKGKPAFQLDSSKRYMTKLKYEMVPKLDNKGRPVQKDGKTVMVKAPMTNEAWGECVLPKWYSTLVPFKQRLRLGLDLQGGTHLVLRVDVDKAIARKVGRLAEDLGRFLVTQKKVIRRKSDLFHDPSKMFVEIKIKKSADFLKIRKMIEKRWDTVKVRASNKANVYTVQFNDEKIKKDREAAVTQAIEIIRGRVDSLGVSEPSISKFGETDIVIQLPGLKNPQRAKELIGKTALLTFHVVEDDSRDSQTVYNEMKKNAPKGVTAQVTTYQRPPDAKERMGYDRFFMGNDRTALKKWVAEWNKKLLRGFSDRKYERQYMLMLGRYDTGAAKKEDMPWRTYFLWREASITGEMLEEARPQLDPQRNTPEVGLNFNLRGADKFESMTAAHVGHRFAIVLEGKVNSAPVIQARIGGGRARITLGGSKNYEESLQEAKDLAFVLKSGSLPAPVDILYEKTIGPALGQDSIRRGVLSVLIGLGLVLIFMLLYYRGSGFNAVLALVLNMVFIMAIMASFGAVLTLPGIAGILLTVGMAVDANILIFERIREELRAGKTVRIAVQNGYDKAFVTILDANITTAIAGIVLYQYGSGPIRGFAVTLLIGIICSVFTALFVTRLIFQIFTTRRSMTKLSI